MGLDSQQFQKIIDHAWEYGHFKNPKFPNGQNVHEQDIPNLDPSTQDAIDAIASMQESDIALDQLSLAFHMRTPTWIDDETGEPTDRADGDAGPATLALTDIPRCGMPDFGYEEEYGEAGRGGWQTCDPESDADHSVRIYLDERRAPSKWKGYLEEVKQNCVDASAGIGLAVRFVESGSGYEQSSIFKRIPGGVIGYNYIPQGGCRRIPNGALDTDYQPGVKFASLLAIHEMCGHGIGLQHTRGGTMNPSIVNSPIDWHEGPSPSLPALKRLYGGVPLPTTPKPDPDPESPNPDDPGGVLRIDDGKLVFTCSSPGTYHLKVIESSNI